MIMLQKHTTQQGSAFSTAVLPLLLMSNPHHLLFKQVHAAGLVSMMLHDVIVKTVVLVGLTGMHKTGCFGETRLLLHVPSSS